MDNQSERFSWCLLNIAGLQKALFTIFRLQFAADCPSDSLVV